MYKKFIILIIFVFAAVLVWRFAVPIKKISQNLPEEIKSTASSTLAQIQSAVPEISLPTPLKQLAPASSQNQPLTHAGVIAWTNTNRAENGNLPALTENAKLDAAAQAKLADMFKQQYFEHINPEGKGPSDLDAAQGYAYIAIGENLALGNFKDNQDLLTAWMNSPGHRANILDPKYTEMGAAVGQGLYQGSETWLAVQEFGRPASSCPTVDANLKLQLDSLQAQAAENQAQITALKTQMDSENPQTQAGYNNYNQQVAQYNNLVNIYNNEVDTSKQVTSQYNAQVTAYNSCLEN